LFMGVMAYLSSPLWLLFLVISTINAFDLANTFFAGPRPEDYTSVFGYKVAVPAALSLFVFTMVLLFLPKLVSIVVMLGRGEEVERYGGRARFVLSALSEIVISALLAPVNMMFNSKFVLFTLLGQ